MEKLSTRQRIAKNLDFLMRKFERNELDVAKAAKMSQKTVNNLLHNRHPAKVDTVERIAKAFSLEGWQLLLPELPETIDQLESTKRLMENYLESSSEGQKIIAQIAEREATYGKRN